MSGGAKEGAGPDEPTADGGSGLCTVPFTVATGGGCHRRYTASQRDKRYTPYSATTKNGGTKPARTLLSLRGRCLAVRRHICLLFMPLSEATGTLPEERNAHSAGDHAPDVTPVTTPGRTSRRHSTKLDGSNVQIPGMICFESLVASLKSVAHTPVLTVLTAEFLGWIAFPVNTYPMAPC